MEHSETQKQIINLGKALVQELELEPSVDTLGRWMAHYIAEQMLIAEKALGDEKTKAQQHCFDTILAVWNHRSTLPRGHRPFENFEPIFRALERLDPDNPRPFYYQQETDDELKLTEVKQWIDLVIGIDNAAKVLINFAFAQAAQNATDDKTISWLKNKVNLNYDDISIITHFYQEKDNQENTEQIRQLKLNIEKIDTFLEISKVVLSELSDNLKKLLDV